MTELNWPPGARRRARPAKNPLTRPEIVRTALRLVQSEGIDAVSMRRLAAEFDTGPASLYAHVTNKDELLQLMFDEMCGLITIPELDPPRWQEQVKELARSGHAALVAHNDLARAALATIPTGPNALLVSDAMLGMMLAGGIPARIATWAMDRIFLYITSDAYEYSIWRRQVREAGSDKTTYIGQLGAEVQSYFDQLPPDLYPNVRRHASELMGGTPEDRFDLGLDLLVDGLVRYAANQ
ncbi:TetR/AcrR family transcriptional regulator [Actinoplanes bogorensis]|uniref:TetR/AcrR family transcriptional regulator n=1 Tax=Paractinoplanes bogorensis TaxID=1610840 RepID=A0ABS5YVX1_9ACTN|nr:TetR/AcrR family transcriptional regulator [Actinoplanes bogorensis]MBU2667588.1 TetR/AcrR family transcriptional regulator [Actinoplanes bogorensis]